MKLVENIFSTSIVYIRCLERDILSCFVSVYLIIGPTEDFSSGLPGEERSKEKLRAPKFLERLLPWKKTI